MNIYNTFVKEKITFVSILLAIFFANTLNAQCTRQVNNTVWCKQNTSYVFFFRQYGTTDLEWWENDNLVWAECGNTAYLRGTARSRSNNHLWSVDVTFTGRTTTMPSGIHKEHDCHSYSTSDWFYYSSFTGTIRDLTTNSNQHTFTRDGPAFQIGTDGNNSDSDNQFGASGWFTITSGSQFVNGDINIRLGNCSTPNLGNITGDQTACGSYDPSIINSTGNFSQVNYVWEKRTTGSWAVINGATAATYNPPAITQTTQYRRQAKFSQCSNWENSSIVTKTVISNYTNGGTIAGNQSNCGGYDPSNITSSTNPSGGSGGTLQYLWQQKVGNEAWTSINSATAATYNPPAITQTTLYRRVARRSSCATYFPSNIITKTVINNFTNGGTIAGNQSNCGGYGPIAVRLRDF